MAKPVSHFAGAAGAAGVVGVVGRVVIGGPSRRRETHVQADPGRSALAHPQRVIPR
ncbi:hypothetical protein GCM10009609_17660 [Pseudonocardia aurantiaca]